MIYFIYGEDVYRSKRKLDEMISGYRKVHTSGLNLLYADADGQNFGDFYSGLRVNSMFAEKKLAVLKNIFNNLKFQEDFLENIKALEEFKDILVIYENDTPDKRTKLFKALQKSVKCQEFEFLQPAQLKKWVTGEFEKHGARINPDALDVIASFVGSDLLEMENEIIKLINYKPASAGGVVIKKEDVLLLVKPSVKNEEKLIFKTVEAIASKDKKSALSLIRKHLDEGESPLYLISMIAYQFRNLLIIKDLQDAHVPYGAIAKKSGLHPFVVQKSFYLCNQFSFEKLKKIYLKIFEVDSDAKTGKMDAELAVDLLLAEI